MYKVLLIDANDRWLSKSKNIPEQVGLPLGLMYLSAYLKNNLNYPVNIKLLNTLVDVKDLQGIKLVIAEFKPDLIGIRVLTANFNYFKDLLLQLPFGIDVVVGGPHVSLDPHSVLILDGVDFVVLNEGEQTFLELVLALIGGQDISNISGLGFKKGKQRLINQKHEFIDNLDLIPMPDYSLIDLNRYSQLLNYGYTMRRPGFLLTSRGCPFECSYCFNFLGKRYRKRSAGNIFSELKYLYENYCIRDFFIVDDIFNMDRKRCIGFLKKIIKSDLKINIYFSNGLKWELLDQELLDLLIHAGMIELRLGAETVNKRIQKIANRYLEIDKFREIVDYCSSKDVMVGVTCMIGFPTETKAEALETIKFLKSFQNITMPYLLFVKYFPGTRLYEIAKEKGSITKLSQQGVYSTYHDVSTNETNTMNAEDFKSLFLTYLKDVFLDENRLKYALNIQRKHMSEQEINTLYSTFLKREIDSPEKVFGLVNPD